MGRRWCRPLLHYAFLLLSCILPSLLVSGAQAPPSRCSSFQPQLWIRKHLLPSALDTRDRSVTVIVEWQLTAPPTDDVRTECRYLVRVTDSVPSLPLRVPNDIALFFATTSNNSFVHREYPIVLEKDDVPTVMQDSWNYTLSVQPLSLTPLNDSLQITLPSPHLTLLSVQDNIENAIDTATPPAPVALTLSLYYTPSPLSLYHAVVLSLLCVVLVAACHLVTAGRLQNAVRAREEQVKRNKPAVVDHQGSLSRPVPTDHVARAKMGEGEVKEDDADITPTSVTGGAAPTDGTTPTPIYRFKAKDTRKRFTRPPSTPGSVDF